MFEKKQRPERIIQFGEGGFLRGFIDWILQITNEQTDFNASVAVVQPIKEGLCDKLEEQKPILQSYVMDEVFNKMESGEAAIAPYYAGDFFTMYGNNEDLAFYYPEEGTNIFIDAACVLKNAKNKEAAELYINFLLDPEIARANAEYMYYASPNTAVIENEDYRAFLDELHPDAYEILYEASAKVKTDSFGDLSASTKEYMTKRWTDLRATNTDQSADYIVYAICIVILIIIIAWFAYSAIRKRKRAQQY